MAGAKHSGFQTHRIFTKKKKNQNNQKRILGFTSFQPSAQFNSFTHLFPSLNKMKSFKKKEEKK